jgi:thiamine-phosphate pyrophosphorylase
VNPRAGRRPGRIYAIADAGRLGAERVPEAVAEMASAGIETIQIRAKSLADDLLWRVSEGALGRLAGWRGELWIDDRVDLAAALPYAGVHLGQRDLPPAAARPLLPDAAAIGASTHHRAQLDAAAADAAVDWVAVGPVFATRSKEDPDPELGLAGIADLAGRTAKPVIAIGGITADRVARVLAAGADAVAVISAVCDGDVAANCRRLLAAARSAA